MAGLYHSLYDRMVRAGALYKGFQKVRSAGGAAGVDGQSIEDFAEDLEQNLATLAKELRKKSYRPKPVKRVEIPKSGGGKRKLGKAANYSCVYGAGGATVARSAGISEREGSKLVEAYW